MKGSLRNSRVFCVVNNFCISLWFDQPTRFPPSAFNDTKAGPKFDSNCRTAVKGHFGYLHMECINPVIVWIPWSGQCWTLWLHYLVLSSQSYSLSLYAAVFLSHTKVLSLSGFPTQTCSVSSSLPPHWGVLNRTHPTPPKLTLPSAIQIQTKSTWSHLDLLFIHHHHACCQNKHCCNDGTMCEMVVGRDSFLKRRATRNLRLS